MDNKNQEKTKPDPGKKQKEKEEREREKKLDDEIEQSFPASDPPSHTPPDYDKKDRK